MAMDFENLLKFYARKPIQKAILDLAKDREVAVRYSDGGFGKRPDILQYGSDVFEFARSGASSFHVSEERWSNPLQIVTGMPRKELNALRSGWDCVLDIDSAYVEYSQITTFLLIEALKFYNIKSFGVKFSGRKGFHILIPFEAFPKEVDGKPTSQLFPEGPRKVADFLGNMIFDKLSEKILSEATIEEISKFTGKPLEEITLDGKFNPFAIVDIDTILISSRHLFRSVYSVNEKSGLISVPVDPDKINKFKLGKAKIENVNTDIEFLKKPIEPEARSLLIQAFDAPNKDSKLTRKSTIVVQGKDYFAQPEKKNFEAVVVDNKLVKEEYYPPCVKKALDGIKEDGKKRALFILLNFLKSLNYSPEEIKHKMDEWNKKNGDPVREGYLIAQLNAVNRSASLLPPNCANEGYYKALGICSPDGLCAKIKNPLNYTLIKMRFDAQKNTKKKVVKKKTTRKRATKKKTAKKPKQTSPKQN